MAEKKKKYGNMRIMSLDESHIWRHVHGVNGLPPLTARLPNGKLNPDAFDGVLDESLDTDKLTEVYEQHQSEMGYPYKEDKRFCRALVNVSFKYAVKEYEQIGRRFVKYGCAVTDEDMQDHICVRDGVLVAIEVPYKNDSEYAPVENPVSTDILGKYFLYDADTRAYKRSGRAIPSAVSTGTLREKLYADGFDIDGIHYVRYKRSAGSSRDGRCLFIAEPLYADMMEWSSCGLSADDVSDQASWQAYISLTLSSLENAIKLPKKAFLIIPNKVSKFTTTAVCVKADKDEGLTAAEEETEIENVIWDGEALMDASVFEENGYGNKGMMLLRNRFFKTCAFNTNLQKWFVDNGITEIRQLAGYTTARKVEDIKIVVTDSSVKYLKFMPKGSTYAEGFKAWLDAVYEGKNTIDFGVVKTDKPTSNMNGRLVYTNYQLLNTLAILSTGMEDLTYSAFEMLDKIFCDSTFLRYHINYLSEALPDDLKVITADNYRRKTVMDMLLRTPDFEYTEFYRELRNDVCRNYKEKLKRGRFLVNGNNQTIFGNPYEFLCATVDKSYEPTKPLTLRDGEVYTKRFADRTMLTCARNPHITLGNLLVVCNRRRKSIDDYFNLTEDICCVNAINSNIQQRLNGCDYDSDAMLVTDDKSLYSSAKTCYDNMGVPVCMIAPAGKAEYTSSAVSLAKLDRTIADNRIGEIVNLSQFLNSILWDKVAHGASINEIEPIYFDICKLAVLSGMEIDKAKRMYAVDTDKVLRTLRRYKDEFRKANGGKLPNFFLYITGHEDQITSGNQANLDTAMSYIYRFVENFAPREHAFPKVKLSDLFLLDTDDGDSNDSHRKKNIINAVKAAADDLRYYRIKEQRATDEEKLILLEKKNEIFSDCLKVVTRNVANDHVLYLLLKEIDEGGDENVSSAKSLLFACLLYEDSGRLLSKVVTPDGYRYIQLELYDEAVHGKEKYLTTSLFGHEHILRLDDGKLLGGGGNVEIIDGEPYFRDHLGNTVPQKILEFIS